MLMGAHPGDHGEVTVAHNFPAVRVVVAGDLTDGGAHTPGHRSAVRSVLTGERVGVRRGFLRG